MSVLGLREVQQSRHDATSTSVHQPCVTRGDRWCILGRFGMLGSVDANTGDEQLGWDTDQFLTDVKRATQIMKVVLEQGGLAPGGLNFDAKVRVQ